MATTDPPQRPACQCQRGMRPGSPARAPMPLLLLDPVRSWFLMHLTFSSGE